MQRRTALATLGLLLAGASAAAPVTPPEYVARALPGARLAGQGEFRWLLLSIYHAQLWVGPAGYRSQAPDGAPYLLELRYARDLEGKRIAQASVEQMAHVGVGSSAQRQAWLERMRSAFPDVRRNDTLAGLYLPGQGVRFYLNGALLVEFADAEFAQAFFAIWLSPRTSASALRSALLQDAAAPP
ncbi:MAG: chalcone isomerase family protein [Sphingomonadaceae bacterium]